MTKQEAINKITEQGGKIEGNKVYFKGIATEGVKEAVKVLVMNGYSISDVVYEYIPYSEDHCLDSLRYATQPLLKKGKKLQDLQNDPVNKPAHYTDGKIEVIDFIEDKNLNFKLGNAVKYIARAGKKDPLKYVEDLEKAR